MSPPFSWDSNNDAIAQINNERRKRGEQAYVGRLLHVVFDQSSGRLYLPNQENKDEFLSNPLLAAMMDAIKLKIEKSIDFVPLAPPILGDPLDTIRIRKVGDFLSVANFVKRQTKDKIQFEKDMQIPVVEADLSKMPKTAKVIFGGSDGNRQLAFVPGNKVVEFTVSERRQDGNKDIVVHYQKAPFIVINLDPAAKVSDADRERLVVTGYREYAATTRPDNPNSRESPQLQSFKYLMYMGWSIKELSIFVLQSSAISGFTSLIQRGAFLYNAAKSLKADGYPDPAAKPYYYCFKIGDDFPISFSPQAGVEVYDYSGNPEIFRVVYFDQKTSYITVKTPLFIPEDTAMKVFRPKSKIFFAQYDPTEKAIKTSASVTYMKEESRGSIRSVILDVANVANRSPKDLTIKELYLTDMQFERKHISDYPQAAEIIKDLCKKLSDFPPKEARARPPEGIRFDDLEVVVGPWKQAAGFLGGYYDVRRMNQFAKDKTVEPIPGFKVSPPCILIDNSENPSVGDRTNIIIHEYSHHINTQLWVESPSYDVLGQENVDQEERTKKMVKYLQSPDERVAHKYQFKYWLAIGMTKEQIIRKLIGGKTKISDVPVVKEYLGIINEAAGELESEKHEEGVLERVRETMSRENEEDDEEDVEIPSESEFFDPEDLPSMYNVANE